VEHLWSPWRLSYVTAADAIGAGGCLFCDASGASPSDHDELVIIRAPLTYIILNRYPYNNGHLMVAPKRHVGTLHSATPDELSEIMRLTRHAEIALSEAYKPQGINVGINLGRPAGAGVVDHLHVHLVPRWTGDTSFMSVVGNVRVLPEELGQTATRLRPIFERLAREGS
jgi:ATP adenylyltransferase